MKYMQSQRQLDREWMKNEAQIQDWQSQSRQRDALTDVAVQNLGIERARIANGVAMSNWIAGGMVGPAPKLTMPSFGGSSASVAAPAAPAAAPAPAAVAPPAAASAKPPIPTTPGAVVGDAGKVAGPPPAAAAPATPPAATTPPSAPPAATAPSPAGAVPDIANDPDWKKGQQLIMQGKALEAITPGMGAPFVAQGEALVQQAKNRWETAKAPIVKGQEEYSGALGEATGKAIAAIPAKMQARQIVDQRLGEIQDMMKGYQPGAFAQEKAELASAAAGIFGRDFVPARDLANAASYQRFLKDQILNTMDSVKAMGGRPMVTEIESLKRAMAGPELQPGAAAAIIAQARGALKWQDDHDNGLNDWVDKNPGQYNTAKFERQFLKEHNVEDYVTEARHNFPYQGQDWHQNNPEQREVGQAYMTGKGPRVWLGGSDPKKQWGAFTPPEQ
jgi:hypothetical protein